jgi:hypothetical protein
VASHLVTKAVVAGAQGQTVETGTDRMWLETPFGERVEGRLDELLQRVAKLLERDRSMVLALAHALEAYRTVPGQDVAAIMEGTRGPTIDGAVYHDPAFQRQLEEYHVVALRAHKDVATVAMPLPGTGTKGEGGAGRRELLAGDDEASAALLPVPVAAVPVVGWPQAPNGNGDGNGNGTKAKKAAKVATNGDGPKASAKKGAAKKPAANGAAAKSGTKKAKPG